MYFRLRLVEDSIGAFNPHAIWFDASRITIRTVVDSLKDLLDNKDWYLEFSSYKY